MTPNWLLLHYDVNHVISDNLPVLILQQVFVIGEVEGYPSVRHLMADDGEAFPDDVNIDPEQDVAFLAYSSGTTGLPKGIMQTHFGLINTMESFLK